MHNLVVHIFVPTKQWTNVFGTARDTRIHWHVFDISQAARFPHALGQVKSFIMSSSTVVLYSGSFDGFTKLHPLLCNNQHSSFSIILPGSSRLQKLSTFHNTAWKHVKHSSVGGCTAGAYWIGSSGAINHSELQQSSPPSYCDAALRDMLEFAPKGAHVQPVDTTPHPLFRSKKVISDTSGAILDHGLAPVLSTLSKPFSVITSTPFSPSKLGKRLITIQELGLLLDLPLDIIRRLISLNNIRSIFHSGDSNLFSACPSKVCCHALWLIGLLDVHGSKVGTGGGFDYDGNSLLKDGDYEGDSILNDFFKKRNERINGIGRGAWVDSHIFGNNKSQIDVKALKHDEAEVPIFLWNDHLVETGPVRWNSIPEHKINSALTILRRAALGWWRRRVYKSLIRYLSSAHKRAFEEYSSNVNQRSSGNYEFLKDLEAGKDCLWYVGGATWWEWKAGSRLFFWRWTPEFREMARDGIPMYWIPGKLPHVKKPQSHIKDPAIKSQMRNKIEKIITRRYLEPGNVQSLLVCFAVPKGDDVRVVYNGTASEFNYAAWAPNFGLPNIETLIRGTGPDTWACDLDVGDMFLNFPIHPSARPFVGVDISQLFPEKIPNNKRCVWMRWNRCAMGLNTSPYQAIKSLLVAEEFLKGLPWREDNPYNYCEVRTNLPGTSDYQPSKSWFATYDHEGALAGLLAIFVDDERVHHSTQEGAWKAARQVASRECYLGIQDAARKRRPPSQNAGAWAGSILRTNGIAVGKTVSLERWLKTKSIIGHWRDKLLKHPNEKLNTERLRSDRGFLNYIARTYDTFSTFLKGFHLTIDGWRVDRDTDGWKINSFIFEEGYNPENSDDYPTEVAPASRLLDDLKVLSQLTNFADPPIVKIHCQSVIIVKYTFGDASGSGFGISSIFSDDENNLDVNQGIWSASMEENTSNFKELGNFILELKRQMNKGKLLDSEMFLFTDNSTSESAYHNGTSKSKKLFSLVVELKLMEIMYSLKVHLIHVSGTRMIAQGTDGISRGMLMEGVLAGKGMLSFIPIAKPCHLRSPSLLRWVRGWILEPTIQPLTEMQWLWEGHGLKHTPWTNLDGMEFPIRDTKLTTCLWCPAPSIASVALEEIRKSRHKRPDLLHIFICPKLMTPLWRKHLLKTCCLSFYVDCGVPHWPSEMHESLLIAIYFPYLHCYPWTYRRSNSVLEMERQLQQVQKSKKGTQSDILRKFLLFTRRIPTMSERLVQRLLSQSTIR